MLFSVIFLEDIYKILLNIGYDKVYIGGSSTRYILMKKWHSIRDVDMYIVCNNIKQNTLDTLKKIVYELSTNLQIFFSVNIPQPKYRANVYFQSEIKPIHIGYGTHLHTTLHDFPIISLNVVHSFECLLHNGLFDVDTIFLQLNIPLHYDFIDPNNGRKAWLQKNPTLIHWTEYQRGYPRHILRVVRTFVSLKIVQLPQQIINTFLEKNKNLQMDICYEQELYRDILKTFLGRNWKKKWEMALKLGFFEAKNSIISALKNIFEKKNIYKKTEKYVKLKIKKLNSTPPNRKIAFLRLKYFLLKFPKKLKKHFLPIFQNLKNSI